MASADTDATSAGSVISLPTGGGAVKGFSPDLFAGTGNFSVPNSGTNFRAGLDLQPAALDEPAHDQGDVRAADGAGVPAPGLSR